MAKVAAQVEGKVRLGHWLRRSLGLSGAVAIVIIGCEPQVTITTNPGLMPAFDPSVHDYVVRCADKPVQVSVSGAEDAQVTVDGHPVAVGSSTQVAITSGQAFTMDVTLASGTRSSYSVRCLPSDFPQFSAVRSGTPQAEWFVVAPWGVVNFQPIPPNTSTQYVAVFDNHGAPLWWMKSVGNSGPLDAKLLPNGNIAWLHFASDIDGSGGGSEEHRLNGQFVRNLNTSFSPADHHEIQLLPNGNYALARYFEHTNANLTTCGGAASTTITDNEIQELTPDGALVWSWLVSAPIPVSETQWPDACATSAAHHDVFHFNSLEPSGDAFVLSFRHLNAVYKISRSTGQILWKIGGTPRPESLTVQGDPLAGGGNQVFGGQHDARVLPDGTLTVHDNRTFQPNSAPRAVRLRIDEAARTATVLESVSDAAAPLSVCCGSARKLSTGNWVTSWGADQYVTELAPDGTPVLRINFTQGMFSYRAQPLLPGVLTRSALISGMNAQHPRP